MVEGKILRTELDLGLEQPVKILQITNTHITEPNDMDDQRMEDLIEMRRKTFIKEGNYAPLHLCYPRNLCGYCPLD